MSYRTLEICIFYFVHISRIFLSVLGVLNFDIFPFKMLRWCLVSVMCNSSSFHSFIQILHYDCSYIEHVHPIFGEHIDDIFGSVEIRHFYVYTSSSGVLTFFNFCVIRNSNRLHSFTF